MQRSIFWTTLALRWSQALRTGKPSSARGEGRGRKRLLAREQGTEGNGSADHPPLSLPPPNVPNVRSSASDPNDQTRSRAERANPRFSSKAKRTLGNLVRFGTIEGRHGLSMLWGNAGSWVASVAGTNVSERRTRVTAGDVRCVPRAPPCVEREYTLSWKKKKIHKIHDFCPILPDSYTNTTYCE